MANMSFDELKKWFEEYNKNEGMAQSLPARASEDQNQQAQFKQQLELDDLSKVLNPSKIQAQTSEEDNPPSLTTNIKTPNAMEYETEPEKIQAGGFNLGTDEQLKEAQNKRNLLDLFTNLSKAGAYIGAGIAQTNKPITEPFDEQLKQNERIVSDLQERIKNQSNDPASDISRRARDYANKNLKMNIPEDVSYATLKELIPYAVRQVENDEAREARKEEQKYKYDTLQTQKEIAKAEKNIKELNDFTDKQRQQVRQSKIYQDWMESEGKAKQIEDMVKNPGPFRDVAGIFATMKILDPGSVVRPSEYSTAQETGSLRTRIDNILNKQVSGQTLTKEQRKELLDIANSIKEYNKNALNKFASGTIYAAKKRGADLKEIFGENFQEVQPKQVQDLSKKPQTASSEQSVKSEMNMVKVKDPMGKVRLIPKDKLDAALKAGGQLIGE